MAHINGGVPVSPVRLEHLVLAAEQLCALNRADILGIVQQAAPMRP